MRLLLIPILLTSSAFSDTYIQNSTISNSIIGDNFSTTTQQISTVSITKHIKLNKKFSRINIRFPVKVVVKQSSNSDVILKIDKKFIDNVSFKVYNDTLHVDTHGSINTNIATEIVIHTKLLDMLTVGGTTRASIEGFYSTNFNLRTSGTSRVTFLSGGIENFFLNSRGTSQISLENIETKNATIVSKGTSKTTINVSNNLNVKLRGISKVKYFGNPKIQKNIKNLGKLIKLN